MGLLGERAIVLGATMGGLLAARALADYFQTVTVVERDVLSDRTANRRGYLVLCRTDAFQKGRCVGTAPSRRPRGPPTAPFPRDGRARPPAHR